MGESLSSPCKDRCCRRADDESGEFGIGVEKIDNLKWDTTSAKETANGGTAVAAARTASEAAKKTADMAAAGSSPAPGRAELQMEELQKAVDAIFHQCDDMVASLSFSLTIADPMLDGCPLIGCSTGFTQLCGYEMSEITGRNCRFLVDPVPPELVNHEVRTRARDFCNAVKAGTSYSLPQQEREQWMPTGTTGELFCVQTNARKDGTLFQNMFYLREVQLDGAPYIIGLQAEMPSDSQSAEMCRKACALLGKNMGETEKALARIFWCDFPMRRQQEPGNVQVNDDDFNSEASGEIQ
eukprot:gnl/TRDRNA2_/TRDRNA2_73837_c0_seq1.p1 gnl/TRDRNA2_/TRDRNA2_73837_c0~~gnl/TRDRNA2_/TRDRNA2_73837_c0_seq1.p1  ORF type:complete len:308 (-),score=49.53 gnl/TRDRNA2_/TRDRNA2_73837_c0_seq1:117-1007(-)